jgi:predicted heme/steroid binding protein
MMKRFFGLLIVIFAAIALLGCQPPETTTSSELVSLTLAQLAEYDGQDGMPAYIAVSGVIYDVTDSSRWRGGEHNGYAAGQDLTTQIQSISPHGVSVLDGLPIIGELVE